MSDSKLPTEVELVYEVMPCNAMRTVQEPEGPPHACTYFRSFGSYHSYDYAEDAPPPEPGVLHASVYVGRARLLPELLSGCRKAPIMAVGINPNLPGWWPHLRTSASPLFDSYKQFAHYFRYRAVDKLQIPRGDFRAFGGDTREHPLDGSILDVPPDADGRRSIPLELQPQGMYRAYQDLLDAMASAAGWHDHHLQVGEDLAYGNMVACPSPKWTTRPTGDDRLSPMTSAQRSGIVGECFRERRYFLRQLFQSLPRVILVFSQSTANAFIGELQDRFVSGNPAPGERLDDLAHRNVRIEYGTLPDGSSMEARVIFAPHITGNPSEFGPARARVIEQLMEEVEAGRLAVNPQTGHLARSRGACVFCPMLEIGSCDYEEELDSLSTDSHLTAESPQASLLLEKKLQRDLMNQIPTASESVETLWSEGKADGGIEESPPGIEALSHSATMPLPDAPELLGTPIHDDSGPTFVLRGRIVTMDAQDRVLEDGQVLVNKGLIRAVLAANAPLPTGFGDARVIETGGTIYPGLMDLHNHYAYNALPLWVLPKRFDNRSQWPRQRTYRSDVTQPMREVLAKFTPSAEALVRYVEAKAIMGGTTTGQGIRTRVKGGIALFRGAMRNVEVTGDERLPEASTLVPDMRVDRNGVLVGEDTFRRNLVRRKAHFYHLSEGIDEVSRRHFQTLTDFDLVAPSLVGVHALGLEGDDYGVLAAGGAKIVWSPFSNLLLYGKTLDLEAVKDSGVLLSLGCDWSPTGSKNLLQELKVAAFENARQGSPFADKDLVRMVTSDAAKVTGWQEALGSIRPGRLADLVVIAGHDGDPYKDLIEANEAGVELVVVHGKARYGSRELLEELLLGPRGELEPWEVGGVSKAFDRHPDGQPLDHLSLKQAQEILLEATSDLFAFKERMEEEEGRLLSLGVDMPQRFSLVLDADMDALDPLAFPDGAGADGELLADVPMAESIALDALTIMDEENWDALQGQPNLPAELKQALMEAYPE